MDTIYSEALADSQFLADYCEEEGLDFDAVITYCDNLHIRDKEFPDHADSFVDAYQGCYYNFLDFATWLFDETMDVPDHLSAYIDYEAFARDLSHDYWENGGYVFRND